MTSDKLNIPSKIPLGEYLFLRISQANPKLKSVFGVPGDFSLKLLDHLYADSVQNQRGISYVGMCNELNASYAANGYSQAIGGLSVLLTTYGVGELSAINGIASSYSEFVPTLHIVGTTSTSERQYALDPSNPVQNYHHLVQNKNPLLAPNHDVYKKACEDFCVVQETLEGNDEHTLDQIDHVLKSIIQNSRPGYIMIPSDVPALMVSSKRLFEQTKFTQTTQNSAMLEEATDKILDTLYHSKKPSFMSDMLVARFNLQDKVAEFVHQIDPGRKFLKLFNSNTARTLDESLPNFVGNYFGSFSPNPQIAYQLEQNTDTLIIFGYANMEANNSWGYTNDMSGIRNRIEITHEYILVQGKYYQLQFSLEDILNSLSNKFDASKFVVQPLPDNIDYAYERSQLSTENNTKILTSSKLLDFLQSYLQPNDIVVMETCALIFGVGGLKLPPGVQFITQCFYASIGHALPATLGVTVGLKDLGYDRRIITIEGDGSAQMVIQELATFVRYRDILKIQPKIFIMNNDGYTVERYINGLNRTYNDIAPNWNWSQLLTVLGDYDKTMHKSHRLVNDNELDDFSTNGKHEETSKLELIELIMDKYDAPIRLKSFRK